jgi:hypothetical protein
MVILVLSSLAVVVMSSSVVPAHMFCCYESCLSALVMVYVE